MDADAALRAEGLQKSYRGATAVGGVDLDVARGEVFARLGPNGAVGAVTVPFLALQLISGAFVPVHQLPSWLVDIASLFPLKWMAQGMRAVFLPEEAAALEAGGEWQLERVALVLAAWCVVGSVLCLTTFRWKTAKDG